MRYRYMTWEEACKLYEKKGYGFLPNKEFKGWGKWIKNIEINGESFRGEVIGFRMVNQGTKELLVTYDELEIEIE